MPVGDGATVNEQVSFLSLLASFLGQVVAPVYLKVIQSTANRQGAKKQEYLPYAQAEKRGAWLGTSSASVSSIACQIYRGRHKLLPQQPIQANKTIVILLN